MNGKTRILVLVCLLATALLAGVPPAASAGERVTVRYARNFQVRYRSDGILVTVKNPWRGAGTGFRYLLRPRGSTAPADCDDCQVIETPVRRMVALSSTYLAFIDRLGLAGNLVAVNDVTRVQTIAVRLRKSQCNYAKYYNTLQGHADPDQPQPHDGTFFCRE